MSDVSAAEAIVLGVIAIVPATISSLVQAKRSRETHRMTKANSDILKGNGKGSVDKMLEEILDWQGQHAIDDEARFARLESAVKNTARRANRRG